MELDIYCLSTVAFRPIIDLLTGLKDLPLLGFMMGFRVFHKKYIPVFFVIVK